MNKISRALVLSLAAATLTMGGAVATTDTAESSIKYRGAQWCKWKKDKEDRFRWWGPKYLTFHGRGETNWNLRYCAYSGIPNFNKYYHQIAWGWE